MRDARVTALWLLALMLSALGAAPAGAQFYSLEGRYQCLDDPRALCFDATPSEAPAKNTAAAPPAAALAALPADGAAKPSARVPSAASDPLSEIASRLQGGRASPRDVLFLKARTAAGDERATELLAWCHLKGIGMPRDPIPAYLLYGVAARLGVRNAARNQAVVYETDMTPDERQAALAIEDRVMLPKEQR